MAAQVAALALVVACARRDEPVGTPAVPTTHVSTTSVASSVPLNSATSTGDVPTFTASSRMVTAAEVSESWRPGCPTPVEDLRAIDAPHWGFDGRVHGGRVIVDEGQAEAITSVLHELFDARYPIERMQPIDLYGGSDDASVAANNTSAFNCRRATGGSSWSEHAFGLALDLNPLQNPYVRGDTVLPPQSIDLLDRSRTDLGMIHEGDVAVLSFERHGWQWGGHWKSSKDYQHFSTSGR